ncbi:MAG TPA: thiamine pyrophosphate-dependent enzyme [Myxococcota bacterium]|nr:thiamine pyrophosphate-dependent enzyme [Myxococcota bacterium]
MVKAPKKAPHQAAKTLREKLLTWYRLGFISRKIDEKAAIYIRRGMGWSYHARCAGHEGIQVALGLSFRPSKDFLFPYYRDTATAVSAGITPYELVLNGLSRADDVASGGRHMSNHFAKPEINIQNVSSCTGNHTLHAVGVARAIKYYGDDALAFASLGESAMSEGYCYEAINGASREKLPVIIVIQNNGYGISVPSTDQTANRIVSDNFSGFKNLGIFTCDGTDFTDSDMAMKQAVEFVKGQGCPALVHAACVRIGAHSNSDAHDLYRDPEELKKVASQDPLEKLKKLMIKHKIASSEIDALEQEIAEEIEKACERAEKEEAPSPATVAQFLYGEEFVPKRDESDYFAKESGPPEKLREAITRTLMEEFDKNKNTFLWGQDVASKKKGGVFNVTKGLLEKFGNKRVFNAPIAEDFIVGTANGMSRYRKDIRVVIEAAQFADYVWPAMEQIVEMGHDYWRSKGQFCPNVVLRLASGGYITGGLYHSQNVEAIMSHLPGLRVLYPAFADDAAGLLRTAIRSYGPTFFLEPKYLYNRAEAQGPRYDDEFAIPFGKGRVRRNGSDATIITYGNTVHMALKVADELAENNVDTEVFDLRSIKPLDYDGIVATTKRTGKVLIVHEDHLFNGIGGEISAVIMERCFTHLDAPVMRLGAKDLPIAFAKALENAILPQITDIKNALSTLLAY